MFIRGLGFCRDWEGRSVSIGDRGRERVEVLILYFSFPLVFIQTK